MGRFRRFLHAKKEQIAIKNNLEYGISKIAELEAPHKHTNSIRQRQIHLLRNTENKRGSPSPMLTIKLAIWKLLGKFGIYSRHDSYSHHSVI